MRKKIQSYESHLFALRAKAEFLVGEKISSIEDCSSALRLDANNQDANELLRLIEESIEYMYFSMAEPATENILLNMCLIM